MHADAAPSRALVGLASHLIHYPLSPSIRLSRPPARAAPVPASSTHCICALRVVSDASQTAARPGQVEGGYNLTDVACKPTAHHAALSQLSPLPLQPGPERTRPLPFSGTQSLHWEPECI